MTLNHDYIEELERRELRKLSESELGALYLRHNWEKARLARGSWREGKSSEGRIPC